MLTYGKPNDWIEDVYLMTSDNGEGSSGPSSVSNMDADAYGSGTAQYPQEVVISCINKKGRVRASLSGNIKLNIQSEWQEMFGGGIASMSNSIIGAANQLVQWGLGATIQQPWMNRKTYKNTKPFSFSLPLNFVAIDNALEDVVKPVFALVSFCYPRKYMTDTEVKDEQTGEIKTVKTQASAMTAAQNIPLLKNADNTTIVGSALDMFKLWEIPGPSLLAKTDSAAKSEEHKGDAVDIIVGKLFNLGNCYLEGVNINFASSYDRNGYPLYANVDIKATCADSVVCDDDGNFLVTKIEDQSESVSHFLEVTKKGVEQVAESITTAFKTISGFYSGSLQVQKK